MVDSGGDEMKEKFYSVKCKCGHTGSRMYYIAIDFPVKADNGRDAATIARQMPRCKHNHKDCVLEVKEISFKDYKELYKKNGNDPYFKCNSIQEQKRHNLSDRLIEDPHYFELREKEEREEPKKQRFFGKTKIRNPKRFVRNYDLANAWVY